MEIIGSSTLLMKPENPPSIIQLTIDSQVCLTYFSISKGRDAFSRTDKLAEVGELVRVDTNRNKVDKF